MSFKNKKSTLSFQPEHLISWAVIVILSVLPLVFWVKLNPLNEISGFTPIMLAVGKVTGLVGTVLYALSLVLSTRLKLLESSFGGLNRVYIVHHIVGGLSLVFLTFHPLFLALRYVTFNIHEAALVLVPNGLYPVRALFDSNHLTHEAVLQQWATFFGIIAFWGMVILLLITLFIKIPYKMWLFTHKFLGVAFLISGLHIFFIQSDTSAMGALKIYMLTMIGIGLIAYSYKTLLSTIFVRHYSYIIASTKVVGGNSVQINMYATKQLMPFKAGQFVFARFHSHVKTINKEWHPFTISSSPQDNTLELTIKALGDYTNNLVQLAPGDLVDVEGAYGRFGFTSTYDRPQIWIGAGIGITPFLSMLKDLPTSGMTIDLYYCVKTVYEIIDWDKMNQHAGARSPGVRIIPFVSSMQHRHIDIDYIRATSGELSDKEVYICGPPEMMAELKQGFRQHGVPAVRIHTEEFGMR